MTIAVVGYLHTHDQEGAKVLPPHIAADTGLKLCDVYVALELLEYQGYIDVMHKGTNDESAPDSWYVLTEGGRASIGAKSEVFF